MVGTIHLIFGASALFPKKFLLVCR